MDGCRMDGWMDGWMGSMHAMMDEQIWMDGCGWRWMDERMTGWIRDEWHGWMNEWMLQKEGWMWMHRGGYTNDERRREEVSGSGCSP